jgi:hypothetical protein
MSVREFNQLRRRARTIEDFKILAKRCQRRVDLYQKKQTECEVELEKHGNPPGCCPRNVDLKNLLAHYRELSEQWNELANLYLSKAVEVY